MLSLMERRVNIGINTLADETTRHGVLWVQIDEPNGNVTNGRVPLILDKPHMVEDGVNYATWRRLKRQIEKMGIKATHMELKGRKHHYCYKLDVYKELYAEGRTGTPQFRLGMS